MRGLILQAATATTTHTGCRRQHPGARPACRDKRRPPAGQHGRARLSGQRITGPGCTARVPAAAFSAPDPAGLKAAIGCR